MMSQTPDVITRVVHLIPGLGLGGAETMLYQLLFNKSRDDVSYKVVTLGMGDYYSEKIKELGYQVITLPFRRKPVSSIIHLKKILKNTDELCCWMYHANLIGRLFFRKRKSGAKLIWNIRHSNLDPDKNKKLTLIINKICALLSRKTDIVIYNGKEAEAVHMAAGYKPKQSMIMDNGCDLERFKDDCSARVRIRKEFGISDEKKVILSIARNSPIKDLPNFVRAFRKVHDSFSDTVAVMCGTGIDENNTSLTNLIAQEKLLTGSDVILSGARSDIEDVINCCDIYVLHSAGEAFPNTLIQCMACKCLCVTTDVGDARRILDNESLTVEAQNPEKLADSIIRALSLDKNEADIIKERNRVIVSENYDIKSVSKKYESVF